jgi:hypothetical protein
VLDKTFSDLSNHSNPIETPNKTEAEEELIPIESPGVAAVPLGTTVEFEEIKEEPDPEEKKKEKNEIINTPLKHRFKVFTLWKPWQSCSQCSKQETVLEKSDFVCPHTHSEEYSLLLDKIMDGAVLLLHKDIFTDPATQYRYAHMEWGIPDKIKAEENKRLMEKKIKEQVWPPVKK